MERFACSYHIVVNLTDGTTQSFICDGKRCLRDRAWHADDGVKSVAEELIGKSSEKIKKVIPLGSCPQSS